MTSSSSPRLLVTGAGGKLGRRVVELLLETQPGAVVAATRDPGKLSDLAARGAEVRRADFEDAASLDAAFAGIDRLLLISTDGLDAPGRRLAQHRAAIAAAERAGVRHVLYTSAPAPVPMPGNDLIDSHFWTEAALFASPLDWTILRDNIYAEIILAGIGHALATGTLVTATAQGARAYVTREDVAHTAAAALASATGREIYEVGGPAAVTQDEIAALVSELSGRPVRHVAVEADALRQGLLGAGLPGGLVEGLVAFDVAAAQGRHAVVTPTVKLFTGREPTSVEDFLAAHKDALRAAA